MGSAWLADIGNRPVPEEEPGRAGCIQDAFLVGGKGGVLKGLGLLGDCC
ncbi:MAG: hypothetical protein NZ933_06775 [Bacteroidia bacterium]|nr:hypothetical protein [Bacteroidia bacterium]